MQSDCLFCKMVAKEIPTHILYEDDDVLAFKDIDPKAPLHALVIPKKHIATLNDMDTQHDALVGKLQRVAATLAAEHHYDISGFRTIMNCNKDAGQTVFHIHLHLLAGRAMQWPPG